MPASEPDSITVYSDYVCPFCYLGRTSLDRYQAGRKQPLRIDWHPFDLRSQKRRPDGSIDDAVDDGKDDAYFEQATQNVRRLAEQYDVEMDLEIARDIDSLDAQVASSFVAQQHDYETWLAFDEAIFAALWEEGDDIGSETVLRSLAEEVGIDPETISAALADDDLRADIESAFTAAQQAGVTGVPTFVYDGHAARGAVPPAHLERLVEGGT